MGKADFAWKTKKAVFDMKNMFKTDFDEQIVKYLFKNMIIRKKFILAQDFSIFWTNKKTKLKKN